jgi:STE24 endopeptidase
MNWLLPAITLASLFTSALHSFVDWINLGHSRSAPIPPSFLDKVSPEKYQEALRYLEAQTKFGIFQRSFWTITGLAFLWGGGFVALDLFVSLATESAVLRGLFYFAALGVLSSLASLPFSWYSTFRLEEAFGFNRSTAKTFWLDHLKGYALALVIGGPVLAALLWFFLATGPLAWLWAWGFLALFQLVMGFLAPVVLMPLFNKFTPIEEGELKGAIQTYAASVSFQLQGIFTMDGSKRSSKANAFFTGLGKFRRIVLFDTLVKKHTVPELVAVLAHEVGHFKRGHIWKGMALSFVSSFVLFYFLGAVINSPAVPQAFGFSAPSVHGGLTAASWIYGPFSLLLGILTQYLSRKHEFEADAFAANTTGSAVELANALQRLSTDSLSNLNPHPWKVWLEYSHPPVVQRIERLKGAQAHGG